MHKIEVYLNSLGQEIRAKFLSHPGDECNEVKLVMPVKTHSHPLPAPFVCVYKILGGGTRENTEEEEMHSWGQRLGWLSHQQLEVICPWSP